MKKKSALLILMFISMFFIGNKGVKAISSCTDLQSYKTYDNLCIYYNTTNVIDNENLYLLYSSSDSLIEYNPSWAHTDDIIIRYGQIIDNGSDGYLSGLYRTYYNYIKGSDIGSSCPNNIYLYRITETKPLTSNSYSSYKFSLTINPDLEGTVAYLGEEDEWIEYQLANDCNKKQTIDPKIDDAGCELFSDELLEIINEVMTYIRIGVPILLIVLIIIDFASAIFSDTSDKMQKAQSKVLKRIIIAIVIFFVPTLINLILNIANDVWENVENCPFEEDTQKNQGVKDVDYWEKYYG